MEKLGGQGKDRETTHQLPSCSGVGSPVGCSMDICSDPSPWAAWIHAESTFSSSSYDLVSAEFFPSHFSPSHGSCCAVLFTLLKMLSRR